MQTSASSPMQPSRAAPAAGHIECAKPPLIVGLLVGAMVEVDEDMRKVVAGWIVESLVGLLGGMDAEVSAAPPSAVVDREASSVDKMVDVTVSTVSADVEPASEVRAGDEGVLLTAMEEGEGCEAGESSTVYKR